jgi:hypothetical protein
VANASGNVVLAGVDDEGDVIACVRAVLDVEEEGRRMGQQCGTLYTVSAAGVKAS